MFLFCGLDRCFMIYFLRHGQDDEKYVGGWRDLSLTSEGIEQIKDSALWIRDNLNIKRIVSSDIKRALESSEIVSSIIDVPISLDTNLREQDKGLLNGILRSEAKKKYSWYKNNEVTVDTIFPNGESLRDLYKRINDYLDEIMNFDDDTLVVTHRGVINMIYYILNNKDVDMDKKQFRVTVASIHELDKNNKTIKKIK